MTLWPTEIFLSIRELMMKRTSAIGSLVPILLTTACGSHQSFSETSKIIGSNDLVKVTESGDNIPENLRPIIGAFGMLELGCTVTHIGMGLAITAGHCVDVSVKRGLDAPCWEKMTIRWNYRTGIENTSQSTCVRVLAAEFTKSFDYAVLAVDNPPNEKLDIDFSARPANDTPITIFGHPRKRSLEWSQYCVVRPMSDQTSDKEPFDPNGSFFRHQCDTEAGNSGSAIIDATTLKIVGIHNGGVLPWNVATFLAKSTFEDKIKQIIEHRSSQQTP
jgi:V8-like Glu-specific endopeptidase